jgi:IMP dehydrogenase
MQKIINEGLTFDDVLLLPTYSECLPNTVSLNTKLTRNIKLRTPVISSPMDTVTEAKMAIAMAIEGGVGVLHKNLPPEILAKEIRKVKRYNNFIIDPITIRPSATIEEAMSIMSDFNYSGIPVTSESNKLLGILTNRDLRFTKNHNQIVKNVMKAKDLITVKNDITYDQAINIMHEHKIERLIVVDDDFHCLGIITMSDMQRINNLDNFSSDEKGRPMVGVAIGVNYQSYIEILLSEEPDFIVLDAAHGHSKNIIESLKNLRKSYPKLQIIAGNIATYDAAKMLIEAGADAVKVGIGPGSICTTRIVTGVGVPQLTAIIEIRKAINDLKSDVALIADGGIKFSGDVAKAIAAGADCVMIGSMLAACDESAGDVIIYEGRSYKTYRGMGSIGAMIKGSADRYSQGYINQTSKFVPEGVEGMVPMRGKVKEIIHNIRGGLSSAMGYTGNDTIKKMQQHSKMIRITNAGLKEGHVHNITMTKEATNYSGKNK